MVIMMGEADNYGDETESPVIHKAFLGSAKGGGGDRSDRHEVAVVMSSTVFNSEPTTTAAAVNIESWLAITESRNGTMFSAVSHLLSSGIGFQALLLPLPFTVFGWAWGTVCMWIAFCWQLYTTWLLVRLHESSSSSPGLGIISIHRYSRFLDLSVQAFGQKLGKVAAMFPVMYLSGGSCAMMIITGGGALRQLINLWQSHSDLSGTLCFLIFASAAVSTTLLLPNLNSLAKISFTGSLAGIAYLTMLWILSVAYPRPHGVSHQTSHLTKTGMPGYANISFAVTALVIAFRGHNVILEIQGTLPSTSTKPSYQTMWKAVMLSYIIIAFIFFPLAICGYWAYGNLLPRGGILIAVTQFHGDDISKYVRGLIHLLLIISCLTSFSIYAMPVVDNLEHIYVSKKKRRCSRWVRASLRCLFGAVVFFISVAFPFLPKLGFLIGGLALPLTFSYPCFIWNSIRQPSRTSLLWCINFFLGCLGILLSVFVVVGAAWNLGDKGLKANFFKP